MRHEISSREAQEIRKAWAKNSAKADVERKAREQRELDEHQSLMELRYKTQ